MIWLALRLAVNGGREQLARLAVTMVGVGLGALLLLLVAVAYPAIRAHEQRAAWLNTGPSSSTDSLLWRVRYDGFNGRDITRVDVAALHPDAPRPPGLTRLPGPGEYVASPALQALLGRTPAAQLGDRYPGRMTGRVGDAALRSPDSLLVVVGYAPLPCKASPTWCRSTGSRRCRRACRSPASAASSSASARPPCCCRSSYWSAPQLGSPPPGASSGSPR